jgi:hypothetical protein
MSKLPVSTAALVLAGLSVLPAVAAAPLPPIQQVEIGKNAEFRVNGQPFLPLMLWLQSEARIPDGLAIGANTFTGNGGNLGNKEYLKALADSGLYGIVGFDPQVVGHDHLLGWIHGDEPDLSRQVSDAQVLPGAGLRVNSSTPLFRIVDGVPHSWTVLDPLQDAEVTVKLAKPVTVKSLGVWLTVSAGLAVAKDVSFTAEGQEILNATLKNEKGEQRFDLDKPATFSSLTFRVRSTHPGGQVWGSLSELSGYDEAGNNVLLSPPRWVPRSTPEEVSAEYRRIKQADPTRPVLVTFTAHFMKEFTDKYDQATKDRLYPEFMNSCDVAGYDIYPIFGWNKPEWLYRVADGVSELRALAGPKRPVYAWIETNKGSRWVSADKQLDVTPRDTRAEVWMALIRGATAIGYFTHRWVPDYKQFAPEGEMVAALKRLNDQLTRLATALLADPASTRVEMALTDNLPCHFKATSHDGALWIFAQNTDMQKRTGTATFRVEGLQAGAKVEVVDEGRSLTTGDGAFADQFEGLAEHVYRLAR